VTSAECPTRGVDLTREGELASRIDEKQLKLYILNTVEPRVQGKGDPNSEVTVNTGTKFLCVTVYGTQVLLQRVILIARYIIVLPFDRMVQVWSALCFSSAYYLKS